jgi:hypothetical protein
MHRVNHIVGKPQQGLVYLPHPLGPLAQNGVGECDERKDGQLASPVVSPWIGVGEPSDYIRKPASV